LGNVEITCWGRNGHGKKEKGGGLPKKLKREGYKGLGFPVSNYRGGHVTRSHESTDCRFRNVQQDPSRGGWKEERLRKARRETSRFSTSESLFGRAL